MMGQAERAIEVFKAAENKRCDKPCAECTKLHITCRKTRTGFSAPNEALRKVAVVDRQVSKQKPSLVTYILADGTAFWRHATKAVLHIRTAAEGA
jgi:hypothetical protein